MTEPHQKPNIFLLGVIALVTALSVAGFITSLHLMDIHYRHPGRTDAFFNDFKMLRFLKPHIPKKYFVPEKENQVQDTVEEEVQQNYDIFGQFENSEAASGSMAKTAQDKFEDPFGDIQKQDPEKWRREQDDKKIKETCDINETVSCTKVDQSDYSSVGGIAVSLIGAKGYLIMIILGLIALVQRPTRPNLTVGLLYLGSVFGFSYSIYLTYREAFEIKAYCPWCLVSAGIMAVIFVVLLIQAVVSDRQL